ncbi:MAG: hypothetical protein QM796_09770 [Chthoniobacteraceae bacterium]
MFTTLPRHGAPFSIPHAERGVRTVFASNGGDRIPQKTALIFLQSTRHQSLIQETTVSNKIPRIVQVDPVRQE